MSYPAMIFNAQTSNHKRLLHPGADTKLILTQYVATIKCLRIVDPPGVLLFKVADPIRRYLRDRPDTIRCIVANLVGGDSDSPDSLIDDTVDPPGSSGSVGEGGRAGQLLVNPATRVDDYSDPNWNPEPLDAGPEFRANKPGDVLSTLVSIYDSQDLFVKELQVLLAQHLLFIPIHSTSDNLNETTERIEIERRNIEILKLRFGEPALSVCEVMLRDMTDSRRIDAYIQTQFEKPRPSPHNAQSEEVSSNVVHPTIISHHFWPSLSTSTSSATNTTTSNSAENNPLTMPGQFLNLQQVYTSQFTRYKPDKTLRFLPHLGTITLHLEFEDREMDVTVPPLEAALIELFSSSSSTPDGKEETRSEKEFWTLDELREGVGGVDKGSVLKALLTWIDLEVMEEIEGEGGTPLFKVIEALGERNGACDTGQKEGKTRQGELKKCFFLFKCLTVTTAVAAQAHTQESSIPPVASVQQQQTEQMRMYWKVCTHLVLYRYTQCVLLPSSSKECSPTSAGFLSTEFSPCSVLLQVTIRLLISSIPFWKLRGGKEWLSVEMVSGN